MRPRRDIHQLRAYSARRLSRAIDRMILATQPADEQQAMRWAKAWAQRAGLSIAHKPKMT
jgi:hypothetical protein